MRDAVRRAARTDLCRRLGPPRRAAHRSYRAVASRSCLSRASAVDVLPRARRHCDCSAARVCAMPGAERMPQVRAEQPGARRPRAAGSVGRHDCEATPCGSREGSHRRRGPGGARAAPGRPGAHRVRGVRLRHHPPAAGPLPALLPAGVVPLTRPGRLSDSLRIRRRPSHPPPTRRGRVGSYSPRRGGGSHTVAPMGRRVDVEQLVGATDIARRLGVGRPQVVHEWRHRDSTFPEPVARVSRVLIWQWAEVERWARRTGRLTTTKRSSTGRTP